MAAKTVAAAAAAAAVATTAVVNEQLEVLMSAFMIPTNSKYFLTHSIPTKQAATVAAASTREKKRAKEKKKKRERERCFLNPFLGTIFKDGRKTVGVAQ